MFIQLCLRYGKSYHRNIALWKPTNIIYITYAIVTILGIFTSLIVFYLDHYQLNLYSAWIIIPVCVSFFAISCCFTDVIITLLGVYVFNIKRYRRAWYKSVQVYQNHLYKELCEIKRLRGDELCEYDPEGVYENDENPILNRTRPTSNGVDKTTEIRVPKHSR